MVSVRIRDHVERIGVGRLLGFTVVVIALGVVGARAAGVMGGYRITEPPTTTGSELSSGETSSGVGPNGAALGSPSRAVGEIVVHVAGAVIRPGVYSLPQGSRAVDAVEAAGGESVHAAPFAINLASVLADGTQIYIPTKKEVAEGWAAPAVSVSTPSGGSPGTGSVTAGGPVNLNTAGVAELDTLPGIGQVTAGKIVSDREMNGPFRSLEDLDRISGIGEAKIGALKGLAVAQ